jgi:Tol biopolymer transport system component
MSPEQWEAVRGLFHAALDLSEDDRHCFIQLQCQDPLVRVEVESLLIAVGPDASPIDTPAHAGARQAIEVAFTGGFHATVPGDLLGHYEIRELIGSGGMGEVYRARDLLLKRDVALKLLPGEFAADPERMARLQGEAEVLASLNHSNIAQIYGIEDGTLVMELVSGKTLSGRLPPQIAIDYGLQIAGALEYAHARGIVHRDLKPANVMVTGEGIVKVLDFGLARATRPLADSPAISGHAFSRATVTGGVVGTPGYMSPEQAVGGSLDGRTDIWSFGVVLWEMLTGERLFTGIPEVLEARIRFDKLPRETPPIVRGLIMRCLERDQQKRLEFIGDAASILRKAANKTAGPRRHPGSVAAALIALAAGIVVAITASRRQPDFPGVEKWRQLTNFPDSATGPAISRDGRELAFMRGDGGWFLNRYKQLYVKRLPDGAPVEITHDAMAKMAPAFSPDGARVAYTVGGFDTWIAPVDGQIAPQLMLKRAEGLTWIGPGSLLYSENAPGSMPVKTAVENGANQREIYRPKAGMAHFSALSPDRKQVLIVEMTGNGPFVPCRVVPFDGSSTGHTAGPVPSTCTSAVWSVDGKWMYFTADAGNGFHIWRQRAAGGKPEQVTAGPIFEQGLAISPDGRWLYTSAGGADASIWLQNSDGQHRLSGEEETSTPPVISRDGKRIFYLSRNQLWAADLPSGRTFIPNRNIRIKTTGFTPLLAPSMFSPDGTSVVYPAEDGTVWIAALNSDRSPQRLNFDGAQSVQIGRSGSIYLTRLIDGHPFFFRASQRGDAPTQLFASAIEDALISPDEQLVAGRTNRGLEAYRVSDSKSQLICPAVAPEIPGCLVDWALDGKTALFRFRAIGRNAGTTVAVPLKPGTMLPPIPPGGFKDPEEFEALPGARVILEEFAAAGPDLSFVAYRQVSQRWNIFQIPLR